jgi:hypothetical protein
MEKAQLEKLLRNEKELHSGSTPKLAAHEEHLPSEETMK